MADRLSSSSPTWQRRCGEIAGAAVIAIAFWCMPAQSVFGQVSSANQSTANPTAARAQRAALQNDPQFQDAVENDGGGMLIENVEDALSPTGLSATLKVMALLTVLTLAPSILMMTTCFIRFVIVLGLLRQALGTQQLPPNQVITSLCMFLTFTVMAPVWQQAYVEGVLPYTDPLPGQPVPTLQTAMENTVRPLRRFMVDQIAETENEEAIWMLLEHQRPPENSPAAASYHEPENYDEVPLTVILPAFMLSELKTAFIIGFQIYLPFVIIDMVISSVLISMGMMMLPPVLISLPFKMLLFVLIDGWALTVGMLLESVTRASG